MKKLVAVMSVGLLLAAAGALTAAPKAASKAAEPKADASKKASAEKFEKFYVYSDQGSRLNRFVPSGWMGDYGDIKFNAGWTQNVQEGKTCIRVMYNAKGAQNSGWCGIYWQHPANNWGDKKGGYDLTGAKRLVFWARGEQGKEKLAECKVGGIMGEYSDSDSVAIGPIELTKEWQKFTIDISQANLSLIMGGFAWAASRDDNPDGFVIYFDDIYYE